MIETTCAQGITKRLVLLHCCGALLCYSQATLAAGPNSPRTPYSTHRAMTTPAVAQCPAYADQWHALALEPRMLLHTQEGCHPRRQTGPQHPKLTLHSQQLACILQAVCTL
jgi:hypothetical protein